MGPQANAIPTATTSDTATVLVSFELSRKSWLLTVQQPHSMQLSRHSMPAGDLEKVKAVLSRHRAQAERRLGRRVEIVAIHEAGLDGFWLHRWLEGQAIRSHVVDPASILGPQRRRKAKTDRIDGVKQLRSLGSWLGGDRSACSMVAPPSPEQEDARRLSREREELKREHTRLTNRIGGLLANQGIVGFNPKHKEAAVQLDKLHTGDGRALMPNLRASIERMLQRLALLSEQIGTVEAERDALLRTPPEQASAETVMGQQLYQLRGIGPEFATVLPMECFYKRFSNRRELAAFAGLAPTPWASGSIEREQGISKAGNQRLRKTMVELAWGWTMHQPGSALARWFRDKVAGQSRRVRRIAIVALARKLLVALWQYVHDGVVPEGAVLKR
jgi:transposase